MALFNISNERWKLILGVTLTFILLDYIIHLIGLLPQPQFLPPFYFIGKLIALPLAFITLTKLFPRLEANNPTTHYIILGIALQIRYILFYGTLYTPFDHLSFIIIHATLIWISSLIIKTVKI